MILTELHLHHFRNYQDLTVHFNPGVNVLIGHNAQGKTNMLEAIYVLSLTKSHRTSNDHELINWQEKSALISGTVEKVLARFHLNYNSQVKEKRQR